MQTKKVIMILLIIILALVAIVGLWLMGTYNGLVRARTLVQEAFSGIEVGLKKRFDLIPNLVETVKGYAKHESETLENIVKWRSDKSGFANADDALEADKKVTQAISNFRIAVENYPALKADANFQQLMSQLQTVETELEKYRRYYNGTVREYNNKILVFPANIVAGWFGFSASKFFEIENEAERSNPQVKF